ncbi:NAD(P)-binding protein [Alternaria alternata]|uniref:NAD(P)-binding protein n=1 Tax=Alternaria alternata TaxID=5599 RepID=A0A177D579_ALTAL|nr:NAD(P)-binding protein [Alternaria alternata]OAG14814.1 NAD(P)-binding protein [Alternaria alternata]
MSSELVLITGGTGFIGGHVVQQTLEAGYRARLAVRREESIETFKKVFSQHLEQLEFVVIEDITKERPFSDALVGVDNVFHLASPVPGKGTDFKEDYLNPTIKGTMSLLEAAQSVPSIKRVIIDSSMTSLMPLEIDDADSFEVKASKLLAHRACLDWVEQQSTAGKLSFAVVSLHPSIVIGRHLLQPSPTVQGSSNAHVWDSLFAPEGLLHGIGVDVRDVASAHLCALKPTDDELGIKGQVAEFLISAPDWTWRGIADFVKKSYPWLAVALEDGPLLKLRTERAETVLGIKWRPLEDAVGELVDQQIECGNVKS